MCPLPFLALTSPWTRARYPIGFRPTKSLMSLFSFLSLSLFLIFFSPVSNRSADILFVSGVRPVATKMIETKWIIERLPLIRRMEANKFNASGNGFHCCVEKGKRDGNTTESENVSIWLEWKCWKDSRKHRICPQTHKLSPETSYGFLNRARRTKPVIIQQPTRVWRHNWYTRALVTWHAYSCVPGDSRKSFCRQFFSTFCPVETKKC